MPYDPGEGGASPGHPLRSRPRRVRQRALLPQHVTGGVRGNRSALDLVSQQQLQDLVVGALAGRVARTAPSAIVQLQVAPVEEEESGRIVATVEGGEEERRLALHTEKKLNNGS